MDDIKSAFEIAMEKVEKIGTATDEERTQWKYTPEGEKLAAIYLREDINLVDAVNKYDARAAQYVTKGALETLVRNIALPKTDAVKKTNKRAMEGIKTLKKEKVKVENVYSQIRRLFNYYNEQGEQQRQQAYEQVKAEFEAKLQQAIRQQTGSNNNIQLDVEQYPQFQEEWRQVQNQLDEQYLAHLKEYIQELMAIA